MPPDASDAQYSPCSRSDHFGVSWQMDLKGLINLINDPAIVHKAMQAMMGDGQDRQQRAEAGGGVVRRDGSARQIVLRHTFHQPIRIERQ